MFFELATPKKYFVMLPKKAKQGKLITRLKAMTKGKEAMTRGTKAMTKGMFMKANHGHQGKDQVWGHGGNYLHELHTHSQ